MELLRKYCPAHNFIVSIMTEKYTGPASPDHRDDFEFSIDPNKAYTVVRCNLQDLSGDTGISSNQWLIPTDEMESDEALMLEYKYVSACVNFARQVAEAARDYDVVFVMGEGFQKVPKDKE